MPPVPDLAVAVLGADHGGRGVASRRYHAVVVLDLAELARRGLRAPRRISVRSAGLERLVLRYVPVSAGPDYPSGACQASRQRETAEFVAVEYASVRGLRYMAGEKEVYADRAGRLFGADAGRTVREHLRGMTDPDRLHEFGRKSLDCDTLEQLMALVVEDASNGYCPG